MVSSSRQPLRRKPLPKRLQIFRRRRPLQKHLQTEAGCGLLSLPDAVWNNPTPQTSLGIYLPLDRGCRPAPYSLAYEACNNARVSYRRSLVTRLNMELSVVARRCYPAAAITSMILFAFSLQGSVITVASSAGTVQNNAGMATINIVPNPVWANPVGTSNWISYTTTGNPADPSFIQLPNLMVVSFTDTFILDGPVTSADLDVLADDTTDVIINGHMILSQTTSLGPHCTSQPIGCLTSTEGHLDCRLRLVLECGSEHPSIRHDTTRQPVIWP